MVFVRKCSCHRKDCAYCKYRDDYERRRGYFVRKNRLLCLRRREKELWVRGLMRDFGEGVINLDDFLEAIDGVD